QTAPAACGPRSGQKVVVAMQGREGGRGIRRRMLLEQQLGIEGFAMQCTARPQRPNQLPRLNFLHLRLFDHSQAGCEPSLGFIAKYMFETMTINAQTIIDATAALSALTGG
ncbi:MAG: hypothetical protein ACREXQ_06880, partial [Polaromonas sp.]